MPRIRRKGCERRSGLGARDDEAPSLRLLLSTATNSDTPSNKSLSFQTCTLFVIRCAYHCSFTLASQRFTPALDTLAATILFTGETFSYEEPRVLHTHFNNAASLH